VWSASIFTSIWHHGLFAQNNDQLFLKGPARIAAVHLSYGR